MGSAIKKRFKDSSEDKNIRAIEGFNYVVGQLMNARPPKKGVPLQIGSPKLNKDIEEYY